MITTTSEAPQSTATAEQSCCTPVAGSLAPAAGTSHEFGRPSPSDRAADTTSAPGAATPSGPAPAPGSVLPVGEERRDLLWAGRASYRAMVAHTVEQLAESEYLEPGDNAYAWAWRSLVRWAELGADDTTRAELGTLALRLDALHARRRGAA